MRLGGESSVDSGNSLRLGLLLPGKRKNTLAALLAQRVRRYRVGGAAEDGERMLGFGSSVPTPGLPLGRTLCRLDGFQLARFPNAGLTELWVLSQGHKSLNVRNFDFPCL